MLNRKRAARFRNRRKFFCASRNRPQTVALSGRAAIVTQTPDGRPAGHEQGNQRHMSQDRKPPGDKGEIDQPIQAHLGEQLKRYFSSIVAEPVPDRFVELLKRLDDDSAGG